MTGAVIPRTSRQVVNGVELGIGLVNEIAKLTTKAGTVVENIGTEAIDGTTKAVRAGEITIQMKEVEATRVVIIKAEATAAIAAIAETVGTEWIAEINKVDQRRNSSTARTIRAVVKEEARTRLTLTKTILLVTSATGQLTPITILI